MTYIEALAYIDSLKPGGMKMGLARMDRVLDLLGRPQDKLRVVHIAGTNGKGSTARMIQAMAEAGDSKTGLFTSPAVTGVRDTIRIGDEVIPEEAFAALTAELAALAPQMGEAGGLSEFELLTALAITWFAREENRARRDRVRAGRPGRRDKHLRSSPGLRAHPGQPRPHGHAGRFR